MFKFFGKKKDEKQIKKSVNKFDALWNANLDDIWLIDDKNQFLIAMNGWLSRKCSYGEDIDKLSNAEKVFYFNNQLESEVNNGGFSQYFYNSSGNFANETEKSLCAIGAEQTSEIFKKAMLSLGSELPEDRSDREDILNKMMTDEVTERLGKCDNEFYEYRDNLEELNYRYILDHKEQYTSKRGGLCDFV